MFTLAVLAGQFPITLGSQLVALIAGPADAPSDGARGRATVDLLPPDVNSAVAGPAGIVWVMTCLIGLMATGG